MRSMMGIVLVFILAACGDSGAATDTPGAGAGGMLPAGTWQLAQINGQAVAGDKPLLMTVSAQGQVGGDGGCNQFSAQATVDGDALNLGPVTSTLRACADDRLTNQEGAYFKALEATAAFRLEGDQLTLLDAQQQPVLVFARNP